MGIIGRWRSQSKVVVYAIDSSAERNIDQSSDSWSKSLIDSADSAGIASIRYKRSSIGIWYGIGTIYEIVEGVESTTWSKSCSNESSTRVQWDYDILYTQVNTIVSTILIVIIIDDSCKRVEWYSSNSDSSSIMVISCKSQNIIVYDTSIPYIVCTDCVVGTIVIYRSSIEGDDFCKIVKRS